MLMPFKNPEDFREWNRERQRQNRKDPDFVESEAKRKAEWYQKNKAKKREAQRLYRERIKQQNLLKEMKGAKNEQ